MALREIVAQHDGRLTDTDKGIVQRLLADPMKMAFLSAAEVAEAANVHESTVIRLAQKLGYRGYRDLRADLHSEISPARRIQRRIEQTPALDLLIGDEIEALTAITKNVSQAQLEQGAALLIRAQRVFLFAQGHATSLVDLMDRRLRRSGFDTVVLRGQGRDLAERVITLNQHDALLAFAFHSEPKGLRTLLTLAKETAAHTILIGDTLGPLIRPTPDVLIWARRGSSELFQTLTTPMVLCNMLVLTIAKLDEGRSIRALERFAALAERFNADEQEPDER